MALSTEVEIRHDRNDEMEGYYNEELKLIQLSS
jgi:hypothetical protein